MNTTEKQDSVQTAAERLAARLATSDGRRALAEAASASEASASERYEAGKLDPKLLQKRVTL